MEVAMLKVGQFTDTLPPKFDTVTLEQRIPSETRTPYMSVLLQEIEQMNRLLNEIGRSLAELQLGLDGALNMSDAMDALLQSLVLGRVPTGWSSTAYPSLKLLGGWFDDMLMRVEQLVAWEAELVTPMSVWIPGLFNPMAYITAVLQTTARKDNLPLDQLDVWTDVTSMQHADRIESYSEEGMYVHGLFMEGARWDSKRAVIAESIAKELHPMLPVVRVRAVLHSEYEQDNIFLCPVFSTTKRGGTYVFKSTLKTSHRVNKWVLAGVAIVMSDDIAS